MYGWVCACVFLLATPSKSWRMRDHVDERPLALADLWDENQHPIQFIVQKQRFLPLVCCLCSQSARLPNVELAVFVSWPCFQARLPLPQSSERPHEPVVHWHLWGELAHRSPFWRTCCTGFSLWVPSFWSISTIWMR